MQRLDIVNFARSLVGTPFHHAGRMPHVGLDCAGLIISVAKHFGLPYEDLPNYSRTPDGVAIKLLCDKFLIEVEKPEVGGVGLMWFDRSTKAPQHLMIFNDRPGVGVIHSTQTAGRVVECYLDKVWARRICTCYDFPGVT